VAGRVRGGGEHPGDNGLVAAHALLHCTAALHCRPQAARGPQALTRSPRLPPWRPP
jgi:hypothetical protein